MKIDYLTHIWDLIMDKNLSDCNSNVILMKVKSVINIIDADVYKKEDLYIYKYLIGKLIYFIYKTTLNIIFAIDQLDK